MAFVAVAAGVNWAVKRIVASPRPDPAALVEVHEDLTTYGFPSGHVMFAVVCFGGLAILLSGGGWTVCRSGQDGPGSARPAGSRYGRVPRLPRRPLAQRCRQARWSWAPYG